MPDPGTIHISLSKKKGGRRCYACRDWLSLESFGIKHHTPAGEIRRRYICRVCFNVKRTIIQKQKRIETRPARMKLTAEKRARVAKWQRDHPREVMLYDAQKRGRMFNVPCTITVDDIVIPKCCPVLGFLFNGRPMNSGNKNGRPDSPSLDRIRPALGYVPGNVQVISLKANCMKGNRTPEDLLGFARWIIWMSKQRIKERKLR